MELTKQQVIDKILSFNYAQLAEWIKARLHGNDKYFPVYLGHEPNLSEFLSDAFHHIKDEKFRDNFLEILGDLTNQLRRFSRTQIEESKEYINELLFLCGNIKQFDNKASIMEIAVSGEFKGIKIGESDLHAKLLTTLASHKIAGTCNFWIDQLMDNSNKRYANPAFYAIKDYPDKLFEHISVFIDKYKGEAELVLGIMSLLNEYGKKEVFNRFKSIEAKLSIEQKEAVNEAFNKANYEAVYKLDAKPEQADIEPEYKVDAPQVQYVGMPSVTYEEAASKKTAAAVDIDIKVDLPALEADFHKLKDALEDAEESDPKLEKELEKIEDSMDELNLESEKKELVKPFKKVGRFLEKLGDKKSNFNKVLKGTKKGIELAQKVGKTYNKFAQWLALPQVPIESFQG
ncbi:MAG: hypothetical protein GTO45_33810 [Candidatus Aminicenantes bacterium]|nr:hypothetical protein [Candidatus Aminicenantes bacterium]NIM83686.1 hypothetical protein [Candidatus Aminicenantes bacterium]NIN23111.1 hypothetical protein [Candidatus Aminicenantes bacterium]NIN46838.1 hypothetical protein [Candidatus Aminicenantes bacterium]NIN89760.1 hypothetical protein [Candidatus Aminicenantes bacterium]